jgi:hypothetical protein
MGTISTGSWKTLILSSVVTTIAEYIVRFHEEEGAQFPYWLFGWNYLNPRSDSYEIIPLNNQQFAVSLQTIGFDIPGPNCLNLEAWQSHNLGTFEGYLTVRASIESRGGAGTSG